MNDDTMKFCKDCFWAHNEGSWLKTIPNYNWVCKNWVCKHPTSVLEPQIDYVLGRQGMALPMRCTAVRGDPQRCGPEGRYWEPLGFG